jgi:rod shape-determining protein MreB
MAEPFDRRRFPRWTSTSLAVDLGTANTRMWVRGEGFVLSEPTIAAVDRTTGRVQAVGHRAKEMVGRTPGALRAVRPMQDGVIADFHVAQELLRWFLATALHRRPLRANVRALMSVPAGITDVERRAVRDAAESAGIKRLRLVEEPMAAAIGLDLPVDQPTGCMVVDLGAGTTEAAVLALGGSVAEISIRTGGDEMDAAVLQHVRHAGNLLIGDVTAERLKIQLGSVAGPLQDAEAIVKGRDQLTGLPARYPVRAGPIRDVLEGLAREIVIAVRSCLECTPPELMADLLERGIVLTGGGALLAGMDLLLGSETGLRVQPAEDPVTCVIRGLASLVGSVRHAAVIMA